MMTEPGPEDGLDVSRWQSRRHRDSLGKGTEVQVSLESSGHSERTSPDQTMGFAAEGRFDQR